MSEPKEGFERRIQAIVTDSSTYLSEMAKFGKDNPVHDVVKIIESCQVVQQPETVFNQITKKVQTTGNVTTTVFISTVIIYDVPKPTLAKA